MRTKEVILGDFKRAKEHDQQKLSEEDQVEMLFLETSLDNRDELRGIREELKRIEKAICRRGA